jgi:hypothetical protein
MRAAAAERRLALSWRSPGPPHESTGALPMSSDDGFGFMTWAKMAGLVALGGLILLVVMLLVTKAVFAWGILGAAIVISGILLLVGWMSDRRDEERRAAR